MKITVLATGSRGDVQPFVALAYALHQAGHTAVMVSNASFEAWVRSYSLDFRAINWDAQATLLSNQGQEMLRRGSVLAGLKYARQVAPRLFALNQHESLQACQDAGCLVYSMLSPWGLEIAEKLDIPSFAGALHPFVPTYSFPTQLILSDLGPLNHLTHLLAEQALWLVIRRVTNQFRSSLGLPLIRFPDTNLHRMYQGPSPVLCSLSPTITPPPPDWPSHIHLHGYWFLPPPPGWQPPATLQTFIESGPPPVYIGFGSMANRQAESTTRLILQAVRDSGQRAVLFSGWGGLKDTAAPEKVFFLDEAPHAWLFPRMAAVIHHGGAGTTAAGLSAGIPQVVVPHMQDQPYWGKRLHDLGVAPEPLPHQRLQAAALAERIQRAVIDPAMRQRAHHLGAAVCAEKGLEIAVQLIETQR